MPATSSDIAAATRPFIMAEWSNLTIKARYPSARDASLNVTLGYCDALADAQSLVNAQGALIGVERRRFTIEVQDLLWLDPASGIPCVTLSDSNSDGVNGVFMVSRIAVDLDREITLLELFG